MGRYRSLIKAVLFLTFSNFALAQSASVQAPPGAKPHALHQAQVEARIPLIPHVVTGSDGQRHLAYELWITSFQSEKDPLKLTQLAVFANDDKVPIKVVQGTGLKELLNRPVTQEDSLALPIRSGRTLPLFLWLTLPTGVKPSNLRHQLTFLTTKGEIQRADDVRTLIDESVPIIIAPPLRAGRWLTVDGPGNPLSHHWGSPVAIDGKLSIPQRFAIDWFGLDNGNHSLRGQHEPLTSSVDEDWVGYGRDVLAVSDGVIVDATDGIANGRPLRPLETPDDLTAQTLYGNFVVLAIAPGVYAHYAHLRKGSVTVHAGEHIVRGAVIGRLGQTGSAGAPHLHFHISDRPTFEGSEGLPFVIDGFTLYGQEIIEDSFDPMAPRLLRRKPTLHINQMPLDRNVVGFP